MASTAVCSIEAAVSLSLERVQSEGVTPVAGGAYLLYISEDGYETAAVPFLFLFFFNQKLN